MNSNDRTRKGSTQIAHNIPKNPFTEKKRDNPFHYSQHKNYNNESYSPHKKEEVFNGTIITLK